MKRIGGKSAGGHPFTLLDVFAESKYAGNQLAVVRPHRAIPDAEMQRIAFEFNFPETTFVRDLQLRKGGYDVRIFTPRKEVPFAGHPTLGTAHVIRGLLKGPKPETVILNLGVGPIPVRFDAAPSGLAWMRQRPPVFGKTHERKHIAKLLGLKARDFDPAFPIQEVSTGMLFLMIPLANLDAVKRARTHEDAYGNYFGGQGLPLFLFSRETYAPGNQINCRMFAHLFGIPEDPATGSANGCLAGYLVKHAYFGAGRLAIKVEQGYEMGRKSLLHLDAEARKGGIEINVGGQVIETARGELA
jgi:trans-2,3-dihydro-3-hydroxyanthranilate isomerase